MTTIAMVTDDATPHVLRAFRMTGPQQMFRELPVNSAQAGATQMKMGTAWSIVAETGVHYATFEDDGEGMAPGSMPNFINKFGGSGRSIGVEDDNFGIGFKTSAIPDNRRGIVVLSLRDGVLSMMWMWFDPITEKIGARVLCNPDLLGDEYQDAVSQSGSPSVLVLDDNGDAWEEVIIDGINWTKVMPEWIKDAGHGTCFVMLGSVGPQWDEEIVAVGDRTGSNMTNIPDMDTIGKVGGFTQKYGAVKEITRRFWTLPLASIEQGSYEDFGARSDWPTSLNQCASPRKAQGAGDFVLESADHVGECVLTAGGMTANVTWAIMAEPQDGRGRGTQRGDMISWPAVAAIYESHPGIEELMDLKSGHEARDRIDQFIGPHDVAKHCMIFVEPPRDQVWQDGTRTVLRWQQDDGAPKGLPWAAWAREFRANQPEPIAALVRAHYAGITEGVDDLTDEDYQRLGSKFAALLSRAVAVLRAVVDGTEQGGEPRQGGLGFARRGPQRNRPAGPGSTTTDTLTPGTGTAATTARRSEDLPKATFDASEFTDGKEHLAVHYDSVGHLVLINPDHLYVKAVDLAIRQRFADESAERQDYAVKGGRRAIKTHASLLVAHQLQLASLKPDLHEELMSDMALTAGFAGVRNLMEAASGYIGDLTRRAS